MVRQGLETWVGGFQDVEVVASVARWSDLLVHPEHPADVVLLDIALGDDVPLAVKIAALKIAGSAVVVISSMATPALVREAVEAGALAYLPKTAPDEELFGAVRAAARGESYVSPELARSLLLDDGPARPNLSEQERRVLVLYASGLKLATVARRLNLKYDTAKSYLDRVREKYARYGREARTKLDLYQRVVEDGWVVEDDLR